MESVLVTGGTGLIGEHLCRRLQEKGYAPSLLSRTQTQIQDMPVYRWDTDQHEIDQEAIAASDYIIHLAGTSIAGKRWSQKRKREIVDSRIQSGQLIYDEISRQNKPLKAFISASATGYYGSITSGKVFRETDAPANDFLGQTCSAWEKMADRFAESGIRTVKLRTGIVLTKRGGALAKMSLPVKTGVGSAIGNGKQYMPWIHIDDLCGMYIKALEDSQMRGAYNAVAPDHITNKEFTRALAGVLRKKLWFPGIPAFVMKLVFGEMSQILLRGSRVSSGKIQECGYSFQFPDLKVALQHLLES